MGASSLGPSFRGSSSSSSSRSHFGSRTWVCCFALATSGQVVQLQPDFCGRWFRLSAKGLAGGVRAW
eukprot:4707422-Alexandrium_andersonii.AAC.1